MVRNISPLPKPSDALHAYEKLLSGIAHQFIRIEKRAPKTYEVVISNSKEGKHHIDDVIHAFDYEHYFPPCRMIRPKDLRQMGKRV